MLLCCDVVSCTTCSFDSVSDVRVGEIPLKIGFSPSSRSTRIASRSTAKSLALKKLITRRPPTSRGSMVTRVPSFSVSERSSAEYLWVYLMSSTYLVLCHATRKCFTLTYCKVFEEYLFRKYGLFFGSVIQHHERTRVAFGDASFGEVPLNCRSGEHE